MAAPVISARGLVKAFGPQVAVNDLSFNVRDLCVTAFLGPNGAGKSTTLRMLLGLTRPTAGEATVFGVQYEDLQDPATRVGVLLDADTSHPRRRARDHLRCLAAAIGVDDKRVEETLAEVALTEAATRRVGEYSLGMRQRLGLAAALLGEPSLLILDEPANGLDPAGIRWLRRFLRSFADAGGAVLVSSHQLAQVAEMADEVVVINRGALVVQTLVAELTAAASTVRARSPQAQRLAGALIEAGAAVRSQDGDVMRVSGLGIEDVGIVAAREHVVLFELVEETNSLEEVFFRLTEEHSADAATP